MNTSKKPKKAEAISALLGQSLERDMNTRTQKTLTTPTPPPQAKDSPKKKPEKPKSAAKKTSLQLTDIDQSNLDQIIDALYQAGQRITTSEAIKIALQLCVIEPSKLLQALKAIRKTDGRRKTAAKSI